MKKILPDSDRVVRMFQSGMTQIEIAREIKKSQAYVSVRLLRLGISRPKRDTYAIKAAKVRFVPNYEIVEMYKSGLDSAAIGRAIGRSHGYVLRHVRAAGVVRSRGEALHLRALDNTPIARQTKNGYLRFNLAGKAYLVHRFVMESHLGRKLGRREHVHHKDGNKQNNALENLELISDSDHNRHHGIGPKPPCAICGKPSRARSLCGKHYDKIRITGGLSQYPIIGPRWKQNRS